MSELRKDVFAWKRGAHDHRFAQRSWTYIPFRTAPRSEEAYRWKRVALRSE